MDENNGNDFSLRSISELYIAARVAHAFMHHDLAECIRDEIIGRAHAKLDAWSGGHSEFPKDLWDLWRNCSSKEWEFCMGASDLRGGE